MAGQRIRTTGAWRDGLYLGRRQPRSPGCLGWAVAGVMAVLAVALWAALAFAAQNLVTSNPEAESSDGGSQVIYLVVPGAPQPTAPPQPAAVAAAPRVAPTATARPAAISAPNSATIINGIAVNRIIVMNNAIRQRIRQIYIKGQAAGRNPRAFAKVGDSTMVYPPFLATFENARGFKLGPYSYLQPSISYFGGSFGHISPAVKKGMHTWTEFDPSWNIPELCRSDETPLACEFRLTNPSVAMIRLGANDTYDPATFNAQLRKIVDFWIANGVIPVLGTKPDRQDADNRINQIVRQAASSYNIPLWDYDVIVATIPGRGLEPDGIHMKGGGSHDYTTSQAFASGDSIEDLTALMMLDAVRREMVAAAPQK